MNKDSFIIQDVEPRTKIVEYVTLQAGKGRAKRSSIYVSSFAFSYVEGLIWDKHREYSAKKKVKISKREWERIIAGFEVANRYLETADDTTDLTSILKFSIVNPRFQLSLILDQIDAYLAFVKELIDWILMQIEKESSVTVIKHYL